jgi:predicted XRE-type DNA-binding protein
MTRKKTTIDYVKSSGNVFADLGLPHPERALLRAGLTLQIYCIIKARHLTDVQASEILGITRPHAALLLHNRSVHFSVGCAEFGGFCAAHRDRSEPTN